MDTRPQIAAGKVLWHFTMSLDGYVAGPHHSTDWMTGFSHRTGLIQEYVETTGAVLGGRDGFDAYPDVSSVYGGAWHGQVFVLTTTPRAAGTDEQHRPDHRQPALPAEVMSNYVWPASWPIQPRGRLPRNG